MTDQVLEEALSGVQQILEADGYALDFEEASGMLSLTVRATFDACADCLVPKEVFMSIVMGRLIKSGIVIDPIDIELNYPTNT